MKGGLPLAVVAAGGLAFANSFKGALVFDDLTRIVDNPHVRTLWPLWPLLTESLRPLVDLSLVVNYALGGLNVVGYHGVNIVAHLLAAVTLYGLVRRTLATSAGGAFSDSQAALLAAASAMLWVVHPLHTQGVTYVIQRAELFMGACALMTLYSVARSARAARSIRWQLAGVLACAAGMMSKAVMGIVPILALLYDRTFFAGAWRTALRQRRLFYLGLAATWVLLGAILAMTPHIEQSAGFGFQVLSPLAYAKTQPGVILHYLRLAVWPDPLVFDYSWPVARGALAMVPGMLVLLGLMGLMIRIWTRARGVSFLILWVLLTLAPTSSVIPLADLAVEYRMYLPLAGLSVLAVLGGGWLLRRAPGITLRRALGFGLVVISIVSLALVTHRRNRDYASLLALWTDTVEKRPLNPKARNNLGLALTAAGRLEEAISRYEEALRLQPDFPEAHTNLGIALAQQGASREAKRHYVNALRLDPTFVKAHINFGNLLIREGNTTEALAHYRMAVALDPRSAEGRNDLGVALLQAGQVDAALAQFAQAIRLKPELIEAQRNLETVRAQRTVGEAVTWRAELLSPAGGTGQPATREH